MEEAQRNSGPNRRPRRTRTMLTGWVAAALLAIVAPGAAASASSVAPRAGGVAVAPTAAAPGVAVSAPTLKRGELFAIAGRNFARGVTYRIYRAAKRSTVGRVGAYGVVFRTVEFPANAPLGRQPVTIAAYRNGQRFQKATVFVTVTRAQAQQ